MKKKKDVKSKTKKVKTKKEPRANSKNGKITLIFTIMFLALMIISYFILGLLVTAFMAVGLLIIIGIAKLLDCVKNKPKQRKIVNTILIIILSLGILIMLAGIVFLIYVAITANPKFDAEKLDSDEPTVLYDINGEEFAKLGSEIREKVTYEDLPEVLVDAIVATEDSRFFQHNGFDAPRFLKASLGQIVGKSDAGGASTLSMQVIKNSITSRVAKGFDGIIRKFQDIYLAVFKLEKNYTKEQIIEFYVNNHGLGGNVFGVSQAAKVYFNKDIQDLNLAEASLIAGMFQAPNAYRPLDEDNIEAATARRNTVLYLMERHGYITAEEREMASSISIESLIDYNASADTTGNSEYQGYIDTVVEEVKEKYSTADHEVNPYTEPMKIYTNLDREKQDGVNRVMNGESYTWVNDVIQSGVTVLDSQTGKILAVGAGRNKKGVNTLNFATSEDIKRQPGSTAKPLFDYGPLIEYNNASTFGYNDGNDNYHMFVDEPYSYSNGQSINNWDGKFMGSMTMRKALSLSRNIPALKAFQQVDNSKIIEFVQKLGIEPEIENGKIHEAHALGAFTGVNSLDMAAAYAAFSNGGYYNEPYAVSKVVFTKTGEEYEHESNKVKAMEDSTAYMITSILDDTSITGGGAMDRVSMKTGTTNFDAATRERLGMADDAIRDSWVVGYTTKTVIAMWYGYEKTNADLVSQGYYCHNLSGTVQRDRLFTALANEVFEKDKEEFTMPDSVVSVPLVANSSTARIAGSGYTGSVIYELFKKGHEPQNSTAVSNLSKPTNLVATYDNSKVILTWTGVNPSVTDSSYGDFGYNVYFNNTLLGFTTNTTYTLNNPSNPYGTYKVVATYRKYDGLDSEAATYKLEKKSSNLSINANKLSAQTFTKFTINSITDYITVTNNGEDVTADTSNWHLSSISGPSTDTSITTLTEAGTYTLRYRFTYDGETKETGNITITIEPENLPSGGDSGETTTEDPSP